MFEAVQHGEKLAERRREPMRRLVFVDVLRGIAILTVIFHHLPEQFGVQFGRLQIYGGRGVDLFFVLSGFLIGSTCLTRAQQGASSIRQALAYWLLRTLRIWPLYYTLMAIYLAGLPFVDAQVTEVIRSIPWHYLIFFCNDVGQPTLELGVLWSLAIEEQFYLMVGVLLLLTARKRETLSAAFLGVGLAAVAVALRARTDLIQLHGASLDDSGFTFRLYFSTLSRVDQLGFGLIGAVVAQWFNARSFAQIARFCRLSTWLAVIAVVGVILYMPQRPRWEFTLVGLFFMAAVVWLQRPAVRGLAFGRTERALTSVLGSAGKLSFAFYLLHPIVRRWLHWGFVRGEFKYSQESSIAFLVVWAGVTWLLSAVSYRWFESPALEWGHRLSKKLLSSGEKGKNCAAAQGERQALESLPPPAASVDAQ